MSPDVILTASSGGQHQIVIQEFTVADSLDIDKLHAVAIVQRDTNRHILNATKATQVTMEYGVMLSVVSNPVVSVMGCRRHL